MMLGSQMPMATGHVRRCQRDGWWYHPGARQWYWWCWGRALCQEVIEAGRLHNFHSLNCLPIFDHWSVIMNTKGELVALMNGARSPPSLHQEWSDYRLKSSYFPSYYQLSIILSIIHHTIRFKLSEHQLSIIAITISIYCTIIFMSSNYPSHH